MIPVNKTKDDRKYIEYITYTYTTSRVRYNITYRAIANIIMEFKPKIYPKHPWWVNSITKSEKFGVIKQEYKEFLKCYRPPRNHSENYFRTVQATDIYMYLSLCCNESESIFAYILAEDDRKGMSHLQLVDFINIAGND